LNLIGYKYPKYPKAARRGVLVAASKTELVKRKEISQKVFGVFKNQV